MAPVLAHPDAVRLGALALLFGHPIDHKYMAIYITL